MAVARILIVTNELKTAGRIQSCLQSLGYEVPEALTNGNEAIKSIVQQKPDLVFVDTILSGDLNGIDTARCIMEDFEIPVIYLTFPDDRQVVRNPQLTDPYGYIYKPLVEKELPSVVEMALYKHHVGVKFEQSKVWFAKVLQEFTDAIIITDSLGKLAVLNLAAERLTGWSYKEVVGKRVIEISGNISVQTRDSSVNSIVKLLDQAVQQCISCATSLVVTNDGNRMLMNASCTPIKNDENDIIGTLLVARKAAIAQQNEQSASLNEVRFYDKALAKHQRASL